MMNFLQRAYYFLTIMLMMGVIIFFQPLTAAAVDYTIDNVKIDAYLQEDGNVHIREYHTYHFTGEFNGIIRTIYPKQGAEILELQAFENNEPLRIETDGYTHRIHRPGEDEDILIEITYTIKDGVQVYSDVAEFYWPFFDKRNESTYEKVTITIHPPRETSDVQAFGRDTAFEKESYSTEGAVIYHLGRVRDGKNGDIRVVYPASLFPGAKVSENSSKKDSILAEESKYAQAILDKKAKQQQVEQIGIWVLGAGIALLLFLAIKDMLVYKRTKKEIMSQLEGSLIVPKEKLSLPATVFVSNYQLLKPETIAASLLDLVRKKHVVQVSESQFEVKNTQGLNEHESILVDFLFYTVGNNGVFDLGELSSFSSKVINQTKYADFLSKWRGAVKREVNEQQLYKNKTGYRLALGAIGTAFIVPIIMFLTNDLPLMFFFGILILITFVVYGISYKERTYEGNYLVYSWRHFLKRFPTVSKNEMQHWFNDDRIRAFLYALGTGMEFTKSKNQDLLEAFSQNRQQKSGVDVHATSFDPMLNLYTLSMISGNMSTSFKTADEKLQPSSGDTGSSSSFSGGGGVGGGGGGSGAF